MDAIRVLLFLCVASFCECRDVSSNVGVYGGYKISIEQAPFMVQVNIYPENDISTYYSCGGTIIHEKFVLTAAHCCISSNMEITVGSTFRSYNHNKGQTYQAESYTIHPNFTVPSFDACLIKVSKSIELGEKVQAIQLADSTVELPAGTMLNVTGWGNTKYGMSNHLMQVSVPLVEQALCQKDYLDDKLEGNITSSMICAGDKGKAACSGDSGGPVTKGSIQVGIISFHHDKGCAWAPGVSTRISSVLEWIQSTINQSTFF